MSSLSLILLQESINRDRESRTILALLREQMDGVDRIRRRRSLKERLGLKSIGCCGATWGFTPTTVDVSDDEGEEEQPQQQPELETTRENEGINPARVIPENTLNPCEDPIQVHSSSMNLAAALAAERHLRAEGGNLLGSNNGGGRNNVSRSGTSPGTPLKMSLMRLLAETAGGDGEEKEVGAVVGNDSLCCVCMGRKKGAAFIPCGHTFCRVCSREIWLNRGSCPLCNRSILEILDIF